MIKFLDSEIAKLESFKLALTNSISEKTADDYCKRLLTICREENIDVDTLTNNIKDICYDYVEGEKKELGKRSHNSYRAALLKYESFVLNNNVQSANFQTKKASNSTPKKSPNYRIEIQRVQGEHFGTIKLYDEANKFIAIDFTKDVSLAGSRAVSDDMILKCLMMLIAATPGKPSVKVIEILQKEFNVSITIDGKKVM